MSEPDGSRATGGDQDLARDVGEAARALELADPDAGASAVDRWINKVAEVIGVAVLAAIVLLVFANAVGRYAWASPVIWAEELVIALIPWLAMSGVFLSVRRRNVIRLDYFAMRLPPLVRGPLSIFVAIASAAAFTWLAFYSFQYVTLFGHDTLIYLGTPTYWFKAAMLIGAAAAAAAFLVNLLRDLGTR